MSHSFVDTTMQKKEHTILRIPHSSIPKMQLPHKWRIQLSLVRCPFLSCLSLLSKLIRCYDDSVVGMKGRRKTLLDDAKQLLNQIEATLLKDDNGKIHCDGHNIDLDKFMADQIKTSLMDARYFAACIANREAFEDFFVNLMGVMINDVIGHYHSIIILDDCIELYCDVDSLHSQTGRFGGDWKLALAKLIESMMIIKSVITHKKDPMTEPAKVNLNGLPLSKASHKLMHFFVKLAELDLKLAAEGVLPNDDEPDEAGRGTGQGCNPGGNPDERGQYQKENRKYDETEHQCMLHGVGKCDLSFSLLKELVGLFQFDEDGQIKWSEPIEKITTDDKELKKLYSKWLQAHRLHWFKFHNGLSMPVILQYINLPTLTKAFKKYNEDFPLENRKSRNFSDKVSKSEFASFFKRMMMSRAYSPTARQKLLFDLVRIVFKKPLLKLIVLPIFDYEGYSNSITGTLSKFKASINNVLSPRSRKRRSGGGGGGGGGGGEDRSRWIVPYNLGSGSNNDDDRRRSSGSFAGLGGGGPSKRTILLLRDF